MKTTGYVCQTNVPSNTAFRGFGSPQTNVVVEDWITRIAYDLNMEPEKVCCFLDLHTWNTASRVPMKMNVISLNDIYHDNYYDNTTS